MSEEEDPVTEWIHDLQGSKDASAGKLWRHFMSRLYDTARKKIPSNIRPVYDEEDAAQSAFHSVCAGLQAGRFPDLKDRHCLWRLLLRVTALKVAQRYRFERQQRRDVSRKLTDALFAPSNESHLGPIVNSLPSREPSPAFTSEFVEMCDRLFDRLKDPQVQQVARLRMEGYTDREIGEKLDCSRRTVQRRIELIRRDCMELL